MRGQAMLDPARALVALGLLFLLGAGGAAYADRSVNANEPIVVSDDILNRSLNVQRDCEEECDGHDNRSGLGDDTNPGLGDGTDLSPNEGTENPNRAPSR